MLKSEFIEKLRKGLWGLPQDDLEERVLFYTEMIDDRMEEGVSETDAVAAVGSVEDIVSQVLEETPFSKLAKEKIKNRRKIRAWEIILLILGSPVWLSVLVAFLAVAISLYAVLWALVISLWSVSASVVACAVAGVLGGVVIACSGYVPSGIAMFAVGLVCAGLSVFMLYGCKWALKGMVALTKQCLIWIKRCFVGRREA